MRFIMQKRKSTSDSCNAHAKQQKERIAAETSNERRVRLSAVRWRRRTPSTLYRGAFSYDCRYDYASNHGLSIGDMSVKCEHCGAMKFMQKRQECAATMVKLFCRCWLEAAVGL